MKITKKLLTAGLLTATVFGIASCGKKKNEPIVNEDGTTTLTIFLYQEDVPYNSDMPVFKNANKYANLTLNGVIQPSDSNYDSIFTLRGKKANIVVNDQDTIEATALKEKIYLNLEPLIEEHAPNLKKYFEENPDKKAWATASDGKIYGIPFYTDGETAKAFFVRQDWVDLLAQNNKLPSGIKADKLDEMTVVQYEELLTAFKQNAKLLLQGYPAETVKHGAIQPEFRTALINISRWYKNGLIEPEILISSSTDKRVTYFASNQGGSTHDWIGTTYSFNEDVYADNLTDNFQLKCILPPTRSDGTKYEATVRKQIGKVTAIHKDTPESDQIKAIKWIDYFFSEKGHKELNYGIEGTHYEMVNDKVVYKDDIKKNSTVLASLYKAGAQLQSPGVQTFAYEEAWLTEEANTAMSAYTQYLNKSYNDLIYPNVKYTNDEYKEVASAKNTVSQVYQDFVNKALKGTLDVTNDDVWNEFVSDMNKSGLNTIVSVTQTAYDRSKK